MTNEGMVCVKITCDLSKTYGKKGHGLWTVSVRFPENARGKGFKYAGRLIAAEQFDLVSGVTGRNSDCAGPNTN